MKGSNVDNFDVLIGIDWADGKHDICEHPTHSEKYHYSIIKHKPEALHDWAMDIKKRYPGQKVAVACEHKKGPLINALSKYAHLT